mgnify:CR=1 FL=1
MISRRLRILAALAAASLLLTGCDTLTRWFDSGGRISKLKGTRISLTANADTIAPDETIKNTPVVLPRPYTNAAWPEPGGYASNAMYHLSAPGPLKEVWTEDVGDGSDTDSRLTAAPIVADGRVFTLDAAQHIYALDAKTGKRLWKADVSDVGHTDLINILSFGLFGKDTAIDPTTGFGGGLAYENGRLFATDGFGDLAAFDAKSGKLLWRVNLGVPVFDAPVADGGRVFVAAQDNHFHAFAASNGRELWDHQGIVESAGILVATSAAVAGEFVVVPYTSGELFALRVQNGRPAWSDMLTRTGNASAMSAIDDVAARPVVDRDMVFAISHSGVMAAISLDRGERVWTRDIGGIQTPWVAGDYVYVLNLDNELVCLTRKEGRIKWMKKLPRTVNSDNDDEDAQTWSGPVLVSDRLVLVSSGGRALAVSPYNGQILGQMEIPDGTYIAPVVANDTVYVLTNDAELTALR